MAWYGDPNNYLTLEQMPQNVDMIADYLSSDGWTIEAISGVLGNAQRESTINPALWENFTPDPDNGFGLWQWTPSTKYSNWAGTGWETNYNRQLDYLKYTMEDPNDYNYISTEKYPIPKTEYKTLTLSPAEMASIFMVNYERQLDPSDEPLRREYADYWYEYLTGNPPHPQPGNKKRFKWWLYIRRWN